MRERQYGWGWADRGMLSRSIVALTRIRSHGRGLVARRDRECHRLAIRIIGQFARDNDCDIEAGPLYAGDVGRLAALIYDVDQQAIATRTDA